VSFDFSIPKGGYWTMITIRKYGRCDTCKYCVPLRAQQGVANNWTLRFHAAHQTR